MGSIKRRIKKSLTRQVTIERLPFVEIHETLQNKCLLNVKSRELTIKQSINPSQKLNRLLSRNNDYLSMEVKIGNLKINGEGT